MQHLLRPFSVLHTGLHWIITGLYHVVFSSLTDPADVVLVLLLNSLRNGGADLFQHSSGDVIGLRQIGGVSRGTDPAERPETQREDIATHTEGESLVIMTIIL